MKIKGTVVLHKNLEAKSRIIVNEGGSRCFFGNQKVITSRGIVAIKDILEDDLCLTFYEGELRYHKVTQIHSFINTKSTMEVVLNNGYKIIATEDHEFFYKGGWHTLKYMVELSHGRMEDNPGIQSISVFNNGQDSICQLQELKENKNYESICLNPSDIVSYQYVSISKVYDLTIEHSHNYSIYCGKPILVHNSSKTYSIAQKYIIKMLQSKGNTLTIARKTMPSLKATVMRDFFEIISNLGMYDESSHNKTDHIYYFNGNLVEFVSMDQPQKKRGAKRNWLWLNEANEFSFEDYMQMAMRTSEEITLDYNPSDEFHWIIDKVLPRPDCTIIKSNYLDNPFLEDSLRREIESLKDIDENYWRVYGLGERGRSATKILNNWDVVHDIPESFDDVVFGIDFGFNNPSVLLAVYVKDMEVYVDELIYKSQMVNQEFIQLSKQCIQDELLFKIIKADSAEPDRIQEWANAGFNIIPVKKGPTSVKDGIDKMKMCKIHVTARSLNTIKEFKTYQWKTDRDGRVLDEPVKINDHACDALRYAIASDSEEERVEYVETVFDESTPRVVINN